MWSLRHRSAGYLRCQQIDALQLEQDGSVAEGVIVIGHSSCHKVLQYCTGLGANIHLSSASGGAIERSARSMKFMRPIRLNLIELTT